MFSLRNLLFLRVSAGYIHTIIENNHCGRDTQVEVAQSNILLQAGEIMLLTRFSGHVLKISKYGDSLYLWPLLQDLFTHKMKKFSFYLVLQLMSVASCPTTMHL